jgi:transcription-repair coupling factor (superfamily II helicase)
MSSGYRRVEIVSAPGEVSRRGGIVDFFSPTAEEPVRIELFGDTVESLRAFDTDHQRSTRVLAEAVLGWARPSRTRPARKLSRSWHATWRMVPGVPARPSAACVLSGSGSSV